MKNNTETEAGTKEFDALLDTIYVIGGKWKMPIIFAICTGGPQRFTDIERSVPKISPRMLARELKDMEMNRLITRTVYPEMPVRIEYETTEYCKTLVPVIQCLIDWGTTHRLKIREN